MRILVIEDDVSLGETLQEWLQLDGYAVDWLKSGTLGKTAALSQSYDCILLDRNLPGLSGDTVLHDLRAVHNNVPILMITAQDTLADKIKGLDLGADDYLIKPFNLKELSARIRSAIRRSSQQLTPFLAVGNIQLDPATKLVYIDGQPITFTAREYAILFALMQHPKHVLSRAQLEDKLYSFGHEIESNTIEVHIHHLRKKLGNRFIRTIRGLGYTLFYEE